MSEERYCQAQCTGAASGSRGALEGARSSSLAADVSPLPRGDVCALGWEGRSLQLAQGAGPVTAGPELVVTASLRSCMWVWALCCSCYCCSFSSLLCPACPIGSDNTPAEAEKRSVFVIVTVFVPCVFPLSCLCFSTLGKEKNKHFLLSALLSPCQAPEVLLGLSWGHTWCLLGEAPQVPASVTGWGFLKGRAGKRAVEGRGMFTLVGGRVPRSQCCDAGCTPSRSSVDGNGGGSNGWASVGME